MLSAYGALADIVLNICIYAWPRHQHTDSALALIGQLHNVLTDTQREMHAHKDVWHSV